MSELGSSVVGKACPYCRATIGAASPSVVCSQCGTAHHSECWRRNGRCTTAGCEGKPISTRTGTAVPMGPLYTPPPRPAATTQEPPTVPAPSGPSAPAATAQTARAPAVGRLRPMGMLEIVDQTFRFYRANFKLFFVIYAVVSIPLAVLSAVPILGLVISVLGLPVVFLAYAALTKAVSDRYLGHATDLGSAYRYVGARFGSIFFTQFLAYLLFVFVPGLGIMSAILFPVFMRARQMADMAAGVASGDMASMAALVVAVGIASVFVAFFVATLIALVTPIVVVEDVRYFRALGRAWRLLRQWTWVRVGGVLILVGILLVIVALLLFGAMGLTSGLVAMQKGPPAASPIMAILVGVIQSAVQPLLAVALILIYYDARIRKEGFDLQMLAREMGLVVPAAAPPAAPPPPLYPPPGGSGM